MHIIMENWYVTIVVMSKIMLRYVRTVVQNISAVSYTHLIVRHMLKYKKAYINTIEIANSIIQILFHFEHDISVSIYAFIH